MSKIFLTDKHSDFLNVFYETEKKLASILYNEVISSIVNDENRIYASFFNKHEITVLLLIHKAFFQNINAFFILLELGLIVPAFNSLRSAIETMRLSRVYFLDKEFRDDYTNNLNIDLTKPEYRFMQGKIMKILNERTEELFKTNCVPFCLDMTNALVTKGAISDLHSELSKWSHLLNSNLLISQMEKGKLDLDLASQSTMLQSYTRKYIEGVYHILFLYQNIFDSRTFSDNYWDIMEKMMRLNEEYIKIFYTKDNSVVT